MLIPTQTATYVHLLRQPSLLYLYLIFAYMAIVFYTYFSVRTYMLCMAIATYVPSALSSMHVHYNYISLPCLPLSAVLPSWYGCLVA